MEDIVRLKLIEPHESNAMYRDALQSYREIYNNSMAKGKGNLEPKFLGGNPIQLYTGNMNSLFKINGPELTYNEYYISTKANGLRFMLLIGNKATDNSRNIYLVNSAIGGNINFWTITQDGSGDIPPLPMTLNIDKCLIDGELLFWGKVETRVVGKVIKEYKVSKTGNNKPLIAFLAFDLLYGPRDPDYVRRKDVPIISHDREYELGGTSAMIGPKALGRWPTKRRRHVLEEMFLNPDSPMWEYIHIQSEYNLHRIEYGNVGNQQVIKNQSHSNFTIFVSPFIGMEKLFNNTAPNEIYDKMINILHSSIKDQYYYMDHNLKKIMLTLPPTPHKLSSNIGKGYSTDGLIFTPANEHYIIGPWTFCNNKQYKWKPVNQLTIDFEIGDEIFSNQDEDGVMHYYYDGLVRSGSKVIKFEFKIDEITYSAVLEANNKIIKGTIVECIYSGNKQNTEDGKYMFFDIDQIRFDKDVPNAFLTAESVLLAANTRNELDFLRKYNENPSVLDLVILVKNNKKLSKDNKEDVLVSLGQDKLLKCLLNKHPELLFKGLEKDIIHLIEQKQQNENFELEVRIDFGNSYHNYSNCLISRLLDSEYTPVPIVKVFDKTNDLDKSTRSVYVLLGESSDSLILEETIEKVPKSEPIKVFTDVYNYNFKVVLSEEIKKDKEIVYGSKNAGNTEYQNRYTITSLSNFWRVDIIEYGNARTLDIAKSAWEQHPKTRVELEYSPASFMEDILNWENKEVIDMILGEVGKIEPGEPVDREILLAKMQNYKNKLNSASPKTILKDLSTVLIKLFNILDMDLGNSREHMEKEKRKEKHTEEPEPFEKPTTSEDLFARLRKFHNEIKSELIEEVASRRDKPISLLDISVGKGGDLYKWNKIGKSSYPDIDTVYGIDPDANSIKEAKKRLAEGIEQQAKKGVPANQGNLAQRNYKFEQLEITNPSTVIPGKFDIVSCQFTLHYFFKSPEMLKRVVEKVANALKPGGYFIGTTMIKENVQKLIDNNPFTKEFTIQEIDADKSYKMKYMDPSMYSSELPEYYVNFEKFIEECTKNGLKLVRMQKFSEKYAKYKKTTKKENLMRPYEQIISELNSTFILQKR